MDQELNILNNKLAILVIGMAGTGKTTFVKSLSSYLTSQNKNHFLVNLDPAVYSVPYKPDVDIRNQVNYKELMTKYLFPLSIVFEEINSGLMEL